MSKAKTLSAIRKMACLVCGKKPSDACHIRTKKASGIDEEFNLMPLCRKHHQEQHRKGILTFLVEQPKVFSYIVQQGWSVEFVNGKGYLVWGGG
jgi:hypothetical protein